MEIMLKYFREIFLIILSQVFAIMAGRTIEGDWEYNSDKVKYGDLGSTL